MFTCTALYSRNIGAHSIHGFYIHFINNSIIFSIILAYKKADDNTHSILTEVKNTL